MSTTNTLDTESTAPRQSTRRTKITQVARDARDDAQARFDVKYLRMRQKAAKKAGIAAPDSNPILSTDQEVEDATEVANGPEAENPDVEYYTPRDVDESTENGSQAASDMEGSTSQHGHKHDLSEDDDEPDPEFDQKRAKLDQITQARRAASPGPSSKWPLESEVRKVQADYSSISGDGYDIQGALLTRTVAQMESRQDEAIFNDDSVGPGYYAVPGNVFLTTPEDIGTDTDIIDFWQVTQLPSEPDEIRQATLVMTSRGDHKRRGNFISVFEDRHMCFRPTDFLVWMHPRTIDYVQLLTSLISWVPAMYWLPVVEYTSTDADRECDRIEQAIRARELSNVGSLPRTNPRPPKFRPGWPGKDRMPSINPPPFTSFKTKYPLHKLMYRVPQDFIADAACLETKRRAGEAASSLTEYLKDQAAAKQPHTLEKLGMNPNLLKVCSVARLGILSMGIAELRYVYSSRISVPINMVIIAEKITSWSIANNGTDLIYFQNLSEKRGRIEAAVRSMRYNSLSEVVKPHSAEYLELLRDDRTMDFADLPVLIDAAHNQLLLIFMATGMRYKYQHAMLMAVERLRVFLEGRDFGRSNPHTADFNKICFFYLFLDFERARQSMTMFRSQEGDKWVLDNLNTYPHVDAGSYLVRIHDQLVFTDKNNIGIQLLAGLGYSKQPPKNGDEDKADADRPKNRQKLKEAAAAALKEKQAEQAARQEKKKQREIDLAASRNALPDAPPPTNRPVKYCAYFNSTAGCSRAKCGFDHKNPPLDSRPWTIVEAFLTKNSLQATPAFQSGGN